MSLRARVYVCPATHRLCPADCTNSRQGFFIGSVCRHHSWHGRGQSLADRKIEKPPGWGAGCRKVGDRAWDRVRHPTAQAERIRWRPHLEALQIGCSKFSNVLYPHQSSSGSQTLLDCVAALESARRHVISKYRGTRPQTSNPPVKIQATSES